MAGFDPSVIGSIGDNGGDPTAAAAKAYSLADMIDTNQLRKGQLASAKSDAADAAKIKQVLQSSDLSTYEGKLKAGEAITKVNPKMGMDFQKQTQEGRQTEGELTKQQYELYAAKNDIVGGAVVSLKTEHDQLQNAGKNPAEINAAMMPKMMQTLQQLEAAKLPDGSPVLNDQDRKNYEQSLAKGYDPAVIDAMVARSAQARQVLTQKLAERKEDNFEKRTEEERQALTERERHDRAGEDLGRAKLDFQGVKLDRGAFTDKQQDLLASMADKNVSLPAGLRSQAQIKATLDGLVKAHPGLSADDIAEGIKSGKLKLTAETSGARTAGTQIGKVSLAVNELDTFGDQVKEASKDLPRGKDLTLNGIMQAKDSELSDPRLIRLKTKLQALNNAYDQLAARGGTDADKRAHVAALFSSKMSDEAIDALVKAVKEEGAGARDAANRTMGEVSGAQLPGVGAAGAGPAAAPPAARPGQGGPAGGTIPPPPPGFKIVSNN